MHASAGASILVDKVAPSIAYINFIVDLKNMFNVKTMFMIEWSLIIEEGVCGMPNFMPSSTNR
jgi:type III secretory pathway component EscU